MKKQIRGEILKARLALTSEEVKLKSQVICDKILGVSAIKDARTVMAYLPFRNEVDVTSLFDVFWSQGKRVVIPVCDVPNLVLIPSELKNIEQDLQAGTWGILEPKEGSLRPVDPKEIDFVIVPGVVFDIQCNRLGYGAGFYDRFLLKVKENIPKIAAAFQMQMVPSLIPDKYDIPMDAVLTEEREYGKP